MDPGNGVEQGTAKLPIGGVTIFLGAAVTFDVVIHVLLRWKNYDWLGKSLGVILLANVALLLVQASREERERRPWNPTGCCCFVIFACCLQHLHSITTETGGSPTDATTA